MKSKLRTNLNYLNSVNKFYPNKIKKSNMKFFFLRKYLIKNNTKFFFKFLPRLYFSRSFNISSNLKWDWFWKYRNKSETINKYTQLNKNNFNMNLLNKVTIVFKKKQNLYKFNKINHLTKSTVNSWFIDFIFQNINKNLFSQLSTKILSKKIISKFQIKLIKHNYIKVNELSKTFNKKSILIPSKHNINLKISLVRLLLWYLNNEFFFKNSQEKWKKKIYVLSKIPFYKMDVISPVTADRYQGNIYTKYNFLNLHKINDKNYTHFLIKLNFNPKFLPQINKIQNFNYLKNKFLWIKNIRQSINYIRQYYSLSNIHDNFKNNLLKLSYNRNLIYRIKSLAFFPKKKFLLGFKFFRNKKKKIIL